MQILQILSIITLFKIDTTILVFYYLISKVIIYLM